jgi:threonylcarbamoyladenosine tRNA methylthiotransferase MtaB
VDVRVQEGCDNMCTYCVVPFLRGSRLESKPALVAVDEVMGLATAGVKEVVLTGTEIGKYGEAPDRLPVLLDSMLGALEAAGIPTRVRISSLNPDAITEALVSQFANHAALCRQLHLPLQSGSDAVLKRMRRPYASKDLLDSVQRLRVVDQSFVLTTDVIVGFPGETEQDLQATLDVVRLAAFAKVHVFPYSPRPFTPAVHEERQVPVGVAKERLHRVLEVAEQTGMVFARRFIGRDVTIVSEKSSPGEVEGYSEHYLWTEGRAHGNETLERDSFVVVRVEGCHFDGDRVVLSGSVAA